MANFVCATEKHRGLKVTAAELLCSELVSEPERQAVVAMELQQLVPSENIENKTKETIAFIVNQACNNGSYKCIVSSVKTSVVKVDTSPTLLTSQLTVHNAATTLNNIPKNFSKTVATSVNSMSMAHTMNSNLSLSVINSQNISAINPWRTSSTIKPNQSVKFKRKRRKRSLLNTKTSPLVHVTANDVIVVEMKPAVGNNSAILAFLVKYRIINSTDNETRLLDVDILKTILLNSTELLESKLNVSIRGVDVWKYNINSQTKTKSKTTVLLSRITLSSRYSGTKV